VIIRILGEGQFDVRVEDELQALDARLESAMDAQDVDAFAAALHTLLTAVRSRGTPVPGEMLTSSELVLPAEGSSFDQVRALLGDSGLIPG
jgi:hypothetical protein